MKNNDLFADVCKTVERILKDSSGGHDFDHTLRVLGNAERIAAQELNGTEKRETIRLSAVLHDCARPEEFASKGKLCHAEAGAEKAVRILHDCGCGDETLIAEVSECVRRHRFRGKNQPETLCEKIIYDADKLDSVGAAGIARSFYFAAACGARLHNAEKEALAGAEYGREDSAYREYLVKLRYVPERMLTGTGRKLAAERAGFMHDFFEELNKECAVSPAPKD